MKAVLLQSVAAVGAFAMVAGCASSSHAPAAAPASGEASPTSGSGAAASGKAETAHKLVMAAAACWSGGPWSEALGQQGEQKQPADQARCVEVAKGVWGGAADKTHVEQLRAVEGSAVADLVAKVDELSKGEGLERARRDALLRLAGGIADEQKELLVARRAADRVKRDLDREPEKLSADEVGAVVPLQANDKLKVLLTFEDSELAHEAHALAALGALDRVELARGLPKHLKLYAVGGTFHLFFGVKLPDVPRDATRKLVPGTWLTFLTETAHAAGHPVDPKAPTPKEKDALAWAGMLEGFHDKLKADADALPADSELAHVTTVAMHRLEEEYRAQKAAEETVRH